MSHIKNLDKLAELLTKDELDRLESSARVHARQSNIQFTIESLVDNILTIETEQGKTSGNYANFRTLIKRTSDVFEKFLPGDFKLNVNPKEYVESPSAVVTPEWIDQQMRQKEVRIKQIAFDTGIDRKDISGWVTGERSMSQIVKAMFFFYFRSL